MEIVQYTPDILTTVTQFYNHLTADVPHCYPVNEVELADVMCSVNGQTNNTDDDLESETAFLAMQNGVVRAFVHVGYYQNGDDNVEDVGIIRFFGYERGERHAGQTVLEKAEAYLKTYNVTRIAAFSSHRYRFYHFGYAKLSNALDHIHALLGFNGYHPREHQVFLDWVNYDVVLMSSPIPITFSVNWEEGRGKLPNCNVTAHRDGEEVGECESVSGGKFSSHPDAQDWVYTEWLGVKNEFQGQGLGKYLLHYSLKEMQKVGYRHASLSADCDDYRPLLFYSNCGYRVVDWTYEYEKVLS